jgi:hypothetical protein
MVTIALPRREPTVIRERGWSALTAAYPGWSEADLRLLLEESSWVYDFEAFTQSRIRARTGRYVNIDAAGFRHGKNQVPWPPRKDVTNIFFFGGSNALGSGLPDWETIPSRLQEMLSRVNGEVAVYNFGRSYFYATQERILFEQLLLNGIRPDIAIFLDGLNEFVYPADEPQWTNAMRNMISTRHQALSHPVRGLSSIIRWFARSIMRRLRLSGPRPVGTVTMTAAEQVVDRWVRNRRMIRLLADGHGVTTLFVWQPVPMYEYDLSLHGFVKTLEDFGPFVPSAAGYETMRQRWSAEPEDDNRLWLADMQTAASGNLYVDNVHYNAAFSAAIAGRIADALVGRELIRLA